MKTQTFNIALPRDLVKTVDQVARKEYRNRSELIREALRIYLKDTRGWEDLFAMGVQQAKKMRISTEQNVADIVADYRHNA